MKIVRKMNVNDERDFIGCVPILLNEIDCNSKG